MRFRLLCFWLLAEAYALASGYADLSGPWREASGDDPRFSQPDYDDSAWKTLVTPLGERGRYTRSFDPSGQYYWLRREVDMDPLPGGEPLALTIGTVGEAYQVFVDGALVGSTGPFEISKLEVARPRTFVLPAQVRGPRLSIAIRVWNAPVQSWTGLILGDTGPWLITPASVAPRGAGLAAINQRRFERLAEFAQPLVVLVMAVIVLLIWAYERSQTELLWLGIYLMVVGGGRLHNYLQLTPESQPFGFGPWKLGFFLTILPGALLAKFVSTSLGSRWLLWPVWIAAATGVACISFSKDWVFYSIWTIGALTLLALALACRPHFHTGPWRGSSRLLLAAILALIVYTHASGFGRIEQLGLPTLSLFTWPFSYSAHVMTVTLFAFGFTLILVRRLLLDRDEKVRLTSELEAARTVQQLLLPDTRTTTGAYEAQAVYEPAQEVGGDFYWSRQARDGSLLVVIGDVSGKGLKAAMLVSVAVGVLRNEKSDSPAMILAALNEALVSHTGGAFVTCCCARFDAEGGVVLANAGHLTPFMNGAELAVESGLPLGVAAGVDYVLTEMSMVPGGQMTLLSDGVVEAANGKAELFGFDRTREISGKSAQEIADAAKAWGQNDDITVVTVRRNA